MLQAWQRQILTLLLLLAGVGLCHRFCETPTHWIAISLILVLSAIPPIARRISSIAQRTGNLLKQHRLATALCVTIFVATYLLLQAWRFRAGLYVKFHDENVYFIQAHMLAHGHLWLAPYPHDLTDFFDSFYLITDRVYAGMYPPGTAILLLPAVWLGLAHWIMPLIAGVTATFFFYLILEEIFDPLKAIVGVLLLAASTLFISMSLMALSESPFVLAQLICFWSWLRWRKNRNKIWLILIGLAAGYGAITRPADMFAVALAIGFAIAVELRRQPKSLLKSAAIICVAASPFLAIQIIQNAGITGSWHESPIRYYTDENYPAPILSFAEVSAKDVPPTHCLPKQTAMKQWILPGFEEHAQLSLWQIWYPERFKQLFTQNLANPLLLFLLPAAILSLNDIRRATIAAFAILFCLIYTADAVFLPHYFFAIAPATVFLVLAGWDSLERTFRPALSAPLLMSMIAIAFFSLAGFNRSIPLLAPPPEEQQNIDRALASLPPKPALVLFRFDPKVNSFHIEPVYNDDVAWPDDATIVRARDLGSDENIRLYRYYLHRGQDRDVYLYDRAAPKGQNPLTRLGTVNELANR